MAKVERTITRGEFLGWIKAAGAALVVGGGTFVLAGCGEAADRAVREQKDWKNMLKDQGATVERDLARVGLMGYHPLVPLDRLSEEKRQLVHNLPLTGYLFAEETPAGANVRFLWPAGSDPGDSLLVTVPCKLVNAAVLPVYLLPENVVMQGRITFDLAKFISYKLVPDRRNPRYKIGQFTLTRYDNPAAYLNTPDAIIGVDIRGSSRDSLSPALGCKTAI